MWMLDTINTNNNKVALTRIVSVIILFILSIIPWVLIMNDNILILLAQTCMFYCTNGDLYEMTLHVCMFVPLTYQG